MIDNLLGELYWNEIEQMITDVFKGAESLTYLEIYRNGSVCLATAMNYILEETCQPLSSNINWKEEDIKDLILNNLYILRAVFLDEAISHFKLKESEIEKIKIETNIQVLYDFYDEAYRFDPM